MVEFVVPVGVAYGTDPKLVEQCLSEVAQGTAEVVKNNFKLPISVYFRSFGASALEFELRCYIYNINSVLVVTSALNHAIEKSFRENGIEFTYNVQDINIRSLPENLSSRTDTNDS